MKRLILAGDMNLLRQITSYCRHQLCYAHGPVEGERQFRKLPLTTAVEMWRRRDQAGP